jgi:hypothetical protein
MTPTADPLEHLDFNPHVECHAHRGGKKAHPSATLVLTLKACPGGCPPYRLLLCETDAIRFRASGVKACANCGHRATGQQWIAAQQSINDAVPPARGTA